MGLVRSLRRCCAVAFAVVVVHLATGEAAAIELTPAQIANAKCAGCHDRTDIGEMRPAERRSMVNAATQPVSMPDVRPGLRVNESHLGKSVHAKLACTDCHLAAKTLPHPQVQGPATCNTTCHTAQNSDYLQGAHKEALVKGNATAPVCSTCHGTHDIRQKSDRESRTYPLNIVKICGDCHQQHMPTNGKDGKEHVQKYLDSVHGRAVVQGGLAVAATCADCHGPHRTLASGDARSSVNPANVAKTCGQCHAGVSETYATSIHAAAALEERSGKSKLKAPVCSDCHTSHAITRTDTADFKKDIVAECGDCHKKEIETYRNSYHGQVTNLGFQRAARCSSCHGSHAVTKVDVANSRLSPQNRMQTCAGGNGREKCHPNAGPAFAGFLAHADHRDAEKYPLLNAIFMYFVIMMSFAFGFFGLHSLLWFIRSIIERIKHGPHPKPAHHGPAIQRFNKVDRINHAFVILSFFGLTITGLPLLYADKHWGATLMRMLGGVYQAGILHRFFALMLIANFVVHGVGIFRRIRKYGFFKLLFGPTTMLMRLQDAKDCLGMFRWFFAGGKKPKFDRWTYWEKFDYMAEVGGSGIIGITGIILWLAHDAPQWLPGWLPGWIFNAATIIHGYEALLAIGFIFSIHFFNAHLRLEKFPVDDVMFTGSLPEEEFKEERGVEYDRLAAKGELDALRVPPPRPGYRVFAVIMGISAMAVGTTLVILIILAGLGVI